MLVYLLWGWFLLVFITVHVVLFMTIVYLNLTSLAVFPG